MTPAILVFFNGLLLLLNFRFAFLRIEQRITLHYLNWYICTSHIDNLRLFSFNSCLILHCPFLCFNFNYTVIGTIPSLTFHAFRDSRFTVVVDLLLFLISYLHI